VLGKFSTFEAGTFCGVQGEGQNWSIGMGDHVKALDVRFQRCMRQSGTTSSEQSIYKPKKV
jgi:hypothetical protein